MKKIEWSTHNENAAKRSAENLRFLALKLKTWFLLSLYNFSFQPVVPLFLYLDANRKRISSGALFGEGKVIRKSPETVSLTKFYLHIYTETHLHCRNGKTEV